MRFNQGPTLQGTQKNPPHRVSSYEDGEARVITSQAVLLFSTRPHLSNYKVPGRIVDHPYGVGRDGAVSKRVDQLLPKYLHRIGILAIRCPAHVKWMNRLNHRNPQIVRANLVDMPHLTGLPPRRGLRMNGLESPKPERQVAGPLKDIRTRAVGNVSVVPFNDLVDRMVVQGMRMNFNLAIFTKANNLPIQPVKCQFLVIRIGHMFSRRIVELSHLALRGPSLKTHRQPYSSRAILHDSRVAQYSALLAWMFSWPLNYAPSNVHRKIPCLPHQKTIDLRIGIYYERLRKIKDNPVIRLVHDETYKIVSQCQDKCTGRKSNKAPNLGPLLPVREQAGASFDPVYRRLPSLYRMNVQRVTGYNPGEWPSTLTWTSPTPHPPGIRISGNTDYPRTGIASCPSVTICNGVPAV